MTFHEMLTALDYAGKDQRIKGMIIDFGINSKNSESMPNLGLAQVL